MENYFEILLKKLDHFVSRFYLNKIFFGLTAFIVVGIALLFLSILMEYFGWLPGNTRMILFYGLLSINFIILLFFIGRPILEVIKISKGQKREVAGKYLGNHFPEIKDKIVNVLDLNELVSREKDKIELILAGIEQKSRFVVPFTFETAIDKKRTIKGFWLAGALLFSFLIGFFALPGLLREPAYRIYRYEQVFERPAPFIFELLNKDLKAFQNEDFELNVKVSGNILPDKVFIISGNQKFLMEKENVNLFKYTLKNLQNDVKFYFLGSVYNTSEYVLKVYPRPVISSFEAEINPPSYTGISTQILKNVSDFVVAEGSRINWKFYSRFGDVNLLYRDSLSIPLDKAKGEYFTAQEVLRNNTSYSFVVKSKEHNRFDSLSFFVQVVKDEFPRIFVEEARDSLLVNNLFFKGDMSDDFGFSKLVFKYSLATEGSSINPVYKERAVPFDKSRKQQIFYYAVEMEDLGIKPGDFIEYFFEVYDNDGVNGAKSTKSQLFSIKLPDLNELEMARKEKFDNVKDNIFSALEEVKQIKKDAQNLREKILQSPEVNWDDRKQLENLLNKQKALEEKIEAFREENQFINELDKKLSSEEDNLLQKKEELDRLFDELFSEEMKKLFEEIQEKLMELNKEKMNELLEKMNFEAGDLEKQLDRTLELFKKFEVEKLLGESIEKLKELEKQQMELSIESQTNKEGVEEKQEELNKEFESLSEKIDDLMEKADKLEKKPETPDTKNLQEDIKNDMNKASEQLNKGQKKDASQKQRQASGKMKDLEKSLSDMKNQMEQDNLAEDAQALREILENLIRTSFSQEQLMLNVRSIQINDPKFPQLLVEQRKIGNDLKVIEDSLFALSKRQASIQPYVNREIAEINLNLEKSIDDMVNRRKGSASSRQQFIMMHTNNLALLLNESLKDMQSQMSQQQGQGKPSPGQGQSDPSFKDLNQMQKSMNDMLEKMQQGHMPEKGPQGQKPSSMSESLARLAAEQEAIRNQLRKLSDKLTKEGVGDRKALEQLQRDMERTEADIVNRNITRQTIMRQQSIMTRLLEHEKAEQQRELDEKREGREAKNFKGRNPELIFEYKRERNKETEFLRTVPPGFKPFYKNLVNGYFNNFEE